MATSACCCQICMSLSIALWSWVVISLHAVFTRRQLLLHHFRSRKVKAQDYTKLKWQVSLPSNSAFVTLI